jgi:conjugal transfer pilus assembly protein TraW
LIHTAGTRVNPLDSVRLRGDLLFLDGDDPDQLAWALKQGNGAKLILVKGAPLDLMKARQRRFYFDQGGQLIAKFGIKAVPARVRQQGRVLEVSEIALPPSKGLVP